MGGRALVYLNIHDSVKKTEESEFQFQLCHFPAGNFRQIPQKSLVLCCTTCKNLLWLYSLYLKMSWDLNEEFLNVHGKLWKITDVYWGSSTTYEDLDWVLQQQLVDRHYSLRLWLRVGRRTRDYSCLKELWRGKGLRVNRRWQGRVRIHFHPGEEMWPVDAVTSRPRWLKYLLVNSEAIGWQ